MGVSYTFLVDGTSFGNPIGWDDLSVAYTFKNNIIREDFTFTIEYCESYHPGSYEYFQTLSENPCSEINFIINQQCDGIFNGQYATGIIRTKDIQFDCNKKSVTITIENDTGLSRLEGNQSETVCLDPSLKANFWQYESGGAYKNEDGTPLLRGIAKVTEFLTELESNFTANFSNNPLFTSGPFQPEINEITVPAISPGDNISLQITSSLGSTFSVNIEAEPGDTNVEIAIKIANALICKDVDSSGYRMDLNEIVHRISQTTALFGISTVITDWEVTSIELYLNGALQPGAIAQLQPFIYSLQDLYVSAEGFPEDEEICLTWQQIRDLFISLFNGVIADTTSGISIDTYDNTFSATPTTSSLYRRTTKRFDQDKLNKRGRFGSEFQIKSVTESYNNWLWIPSGNTQSLNATLAGIPQPAAFTGLAKLGGNVCVINATAGDLFFDTELLLNGNIIGFRTIYAPANRTICIDIDEWFVDPDSNKFCLTAGVDVFSVNAPGGLPGGISFDLINGLFEVQYGRPCFFRPQGEEQNKGYPTYNNFTDLLECDSTLNKGISSQFYTGIGFAISQQIEGLNNYDNVYFYTIIDPLTSEPYKFERQLFFAPNDPDLPADCSCLTGSRISLYYYNMILQRAHILRFFQSSIPSDIQIEAYSFETDVDSSGNYTCNQTEITLNQVKENDDLCLYDFSDCVKAADWDTIKSERKLIYQNCNGGQQEGIIRKIESYLKERIVNITVEG